MSETNIYTNKLRHFVKYLGKSFSMQKAFYPYRNGVSVVIIISSL